MDPFSFLTGFGQLGEGLFGHPEKAYDKSMNEYQKWANYGQQVNTPYLMAGNNAIPAYQNWLNTQQNPSEFINNLMGGYQASPYSQNLQKEAMRAGTNFGSANGLTGSSALAQQMQQNAGNISSQDMNQWLQNVLGINAQYGQGQQNLMNTGQNATNALTNMYENMGNKMGEQAYNKEASKQNNFWNGIGGIGNIIGSFF
jgi:hypothetical protein